MPTWLSNAFDTVYPCDGRDVIYNTINGIRIEPGSKSYDRHQSYTNSALTRVTSLFGIANRKRHNGEVSVANIFLNFSLIPESDAPTWQYVLQWIAVCTLIPFAFNLLSAIGSTLIHTVMLVTELAPLALSNYCKERKVPFLPTLFDVLHFIGRAITSPITNMRDVLHKQREGVAKVLLILSSVSISLITFMILIPVAAHFIATSIIPVIAPSIALAAMALIHSLPYPCIVPKIISFVLPVMALITVSLGPLINEGINSLLNRFFNKTAEHRLGYGPSNDESAFMHDVPVTKDTHAATPQSSGASTDAQVSRRLSASASAKASDEQPLLGGNAPQQDGDAVPIPLFMPPLPPVPADDASGLPAPPPPMTNSSLSGTLFAQTFLPAAAPAPADVAPGQGQLPPSGTSLNPLYTISAFATNQ